MSTSDDGDDDIARTLLRAGQRGDQEEGTEGVTALGGVTQGYYQPSVDDVGCHLAIQLTGVGAYSQLRGAAISKEPLVLDPGLDRDVAAQLRDLGGGDGGGDADDGSVATFEVSPTSFIHAWIEAVDD